jgi:hypothetical protein
MRLFLTVCLLALAPAAAFAQMPPPLPAEALVEPVDPAKVDYLKTHVVGSGPVTGPLALKLPDAVYRARLILLGESHGSAAPQAIDLQLLKELNRRVGLKDYLAEIDPVQAERFNRYLATGDETDLDRVFDVWTNSAQWGNQLFEDKIRKIRALNQTLPAGKRVRFWGLDAIQDWPLLIDWLKAAGATPDPAAFAEAKTEKAKAALALTWLDGSKGGDPATRAALKVGLTQRIAGNRESTIFAGYQHLVVSGALGERPAYGLWGVYHVLQASVNNAPPFATRVRQSTLPAAKSIVSIGLVLLDSAVVIPAPMPGGVKMLRMDQFNIDGPIIKVEGSADLRAATTPSSLTLFDLAAPGSPYATSPDFVSVKTTVGQNFVPDDPKAPATDYLRIAGVVRGSDWAPPRVQAGK